MFDDGLCFLFLREKSQFLMALKTKGFNVIFSPEKLIEHLPGRSVAEIKCIIDRYMLLGQKFNAKKKPSEKNEGQEMQGKEHDDETNKIAIEEWFKFVHANLKPPFKRDDLSEELVQCMREFGSQESDSQYKRLYAYIADCMEGKYPKELEMTDGHILLSLLRDLKEVTESTNLNSIKELLSDISTRISNRIEGSESSSDENSNAHSSHEPASNVQQMQDSPSIPSTPKEVMQKFILESSKLPKIRKLPKCLNPLKIPVSLLEDTIQRHEIYPESVNSNP